MKLFRFHRDSGSARGGFNLVEATFTIGLMSFSFLTLAPLLAIGMKTARLARNDRASAEIAQTLVEEAKQGTLVSGTTYVDDQGAPCNPSGAAFTVQSATQTLANSTSRLTFRVTPVGAPNGVRVYAIVLPALAAN